MPYAEVIGDPIGHSKSPTIHRFWLERTGLEGDYRSEHVRAEALGAYFEPRRSDPDWRGCNVTIPHKQAVIPYLQRLDPIAEEVGAVNLVYPESGGLTGTNSDVAGIIDALGSVSFAGSRACLIGSGGAALAALAAFRRIGIAHLAINARDGAKAEGLLHRSSLEGRIGAVDDRKNLEAADLVVNASVLGMLGQAAMPQTLIETVREHSKPGAILLDMVYSPLDTELLGAARTRGIAAVDGLAMLIGQAAAAFERFFGAPAPREHDEELRALLSA